MLATVTTALVSFLALSPLLHDADASVTGPPAPLPIMAVLEFDLETSGEDVWWISHSAVDPGAAVFEASVLVDLIEVDVTWNGISFPTADVTATAPAGSLSGSGVITGPTPSDAVDTLVEISHDPGAPGFAMHLRVGLDPDGRAWISATDIALPELPVDMGSKLSVQPVQVERLRVRGTMEIHSTWFELGDGLGAPGAPTPALSGAGKLTADSQNEVAAQDLPTTAPGFLVASFDLLTQPLKGGVLFPEPDHVWPVVTDGLGRLSMPFAWPAGVPPELAIYFQAWALEPSAVEGWVATQGLMAVTP
jgi:hypothetical protein